MVGAAPTSGQAVGVAEANAASDVHASSDAAKIRIAAVKGKLRPATKSGVGRGVKNAPGRKEEEAWEEKRENGRKKALEEGKPKKRMKER
jgi:hypothetical protein